MRRNIKRLFAQLLDAVSEHLANIVLYAVVAYFVVLLLFGRRD